MRRVLFLGAHCDDIELGCGGTIVKHRGDWQTFGAVFSYINPQGEVLTSYCQAALPDLGVRFFNYKVREFARHRDGIWQSCKDLSKIIKPDLVFVHGPNDTHQDHDVLFHEATRKTFDCSILCYYPFTQRPDLPSIPQTCYETLTEEHVKAKLDMLAEYKCYWNKPYFNADRVRALMQLNGYNCGARYAEAFTVERLTDGL